MPPSPTLAPSTQMLTFLHRGGAWGYWWTDQGRLSSWWPAGNPAPIPGDWQNIYFGVHPASQKGSAHERSKIATIPAINCLFAELDAKDFGGDKGGALTHVVRLSPEPSLLVDSGGGYHAYWLLREPFALTGDANRERAQALQAAWVKYAGGDKSAKDLARVLRVPGTRNHKYDPPRLVTFVWAEFSLIYDLAILEALAGYVEEQRYTLSESPGTAQQVPGERVTTVSTETGDFWLQKALQRVNIGNRNDVGFWLGLQLRDNGLSQAETEQVLLAYMRQVPQGSGEIYGEREAQATARSAYTRPPRAPSKIQFSGNGYDPDGPAAWEGSEVPEIQVEEKALLTDLGNATRFARQHRGKALHVNAYGWLIWTGQKWEIDETNAIDRLAEQAVWTLYRSAEAEQEKAKQLVKKVEEAQSKGEVEAADKAQQEAIESQKKGNDLMSWARKSQGANRLTAMVTKARSKLPARPREFDKDHWLLNVQNGILDLKTGQLRSHDPGLKMTKIAGAAYNPDARAPTWLQFLDDIFAGDQDLIAFIRRAVGYSLTGDLSEQCLFFLHGKGANGKSTFVGTVQSVLGDYAAKSRAQTFMEQRFDKIPEDVARLAGVRFALTAELSSGQLNESLVKDITGGDKIAARYLNRNTFEFWPVLKLWMYGNEKPSIKGIDDGIWRRIRLIPFLVTFTPEKRDPSMPEKLRAELPGILAWAVQGCLEWQQEGLQTPAAVMAATTDYREEQDLLGQFFKTCCIIDPEDSLLKHHITASELLDAYNKWSGDDLKARSFSKKMRDHGFKTSGRDASGRAIYHGIGLQMSPQGANTEATEASEENA